MKEIICRGVNVADHVAAMFDALVGSLDWGSGFLDAETIESVLIVAELAGFTVPDNIQMDDAQIATPLPELAVWPPAGGITVEAQRARDAAYQDRLRAKTAAIAAWRAQVQAKARAMLTDG